jgi:hypothetical protein
MSFFNALMQHSTASGSRSTALKPLGGLIALLLIGTLGTAKFNSPEWLLILLAILSSISVVLFIGAYLYFMFRDPDALRSEKFNIEKMAIQKGIVGDSASGIIDEATLENIPLVNSNSTQLEDMQ